MRVFKVRRFGKWARGERIGDCVLCQAATEAFAGQVEADLGGFLFKKRIARGGGGKSGGYRTILGFRKSNSERIVFLLGYAKNLQAALSESETEALSIAAAALTAASDQQIVRLLAFGDVEEVECGK